MNENLALNDEQLLSVEKPERYIGNEVGAVYKDKNSVDVRFIMCFPDVYDIGMSHLGIQILYGMFNSWDDVWCERLYSPWFDLDKLMRMEGIPLFALESQEPVKNFDFLGITLQYELCYTNILQILDLSEIPFLSSDRNDWEYPLVIGGGPCTYNPEPVADFFDFFYIGEGETRYREIIDLYKKMRSKGRSKREFLREAAKIPGIYVPSLYDIYYNKDGTVNSIKTIYDDVPKVIKKELVKDLDSFISPLGREALMCLKDMP